MRHGNDRTHSVTHLRMAADGRWDMVRIQGNCLSAQAGDVIVEGRCVVEITSDDIDAGYVVTGSYCTYGQQVPNPVFLRARTTRPGSPSRLSESVSRVTWHPFRSWGGVVQGERGALVTGGSELQWRGGVLLDGYGKGRPVDLATVGRVISWSGRMVPAGGQCPMARPHELAPI